MLDGHQRCATPLAADGKALRESQERQQDWGGQADLRVGGQQADQHGRSAHQEQGVHQHPFASDAVSEVAEHHAPEGSGDEADTESGERQQQSQRR